MDEVARLRKALELILNANALPTGWGLLPDSSRVKALMEARERVSDIVIAALSGRIEQEG